MGNNLDQLINTMLVRKMTTQEWVTEVLREAVLNGYYKDGEPIDTAELSNKLGVSRMPIRIALLQLENEGLVSLQPHKKAVAVTYSPEEIMKIYDIRYELESLAVRLAIERITEEQIEEINNIVVEMTKTNDTKVYMELNNRFHNTIYLISDNDELINLITQLRNKIQRYLRLYLSEQTNIQEANEDHIAIFNAIKERDTQLAELLIREHLKKTSNTVCQLLIGQMENK